MKSYFLLAVIAVTFSCNDKNSQKSTSGNAQKNLKSQTITKSNDNEISSDLKNVICDLDGDAKLDTVKLVQNSQSKKFGLKIILGTGKVDYLGMGDEVLGQGFDDLNWVGIFEKVNKGEIVWNNIDDNGDIITDETEIAEDEKIKLENDAIFIHQSESCGGGIIYLKQNEYHWVQQE